MRRLWQVLLQLAEEGEGGSLSCEECFLVLDYLADLLAEGYSAEEVIPIAHKYLRRCPGCQQEYTKQLAEILRNSQDRPAATDRKSGSAAAVPAVPVPRGVRNRYSS